MEPVLMFTDNGKFNDAIKRHSIYLTDLTEILGAYNSLGIGAITGPEFQNLVYDPASVVFDKMTNGQDVVIGGLKVNKSKALDILEKPEGYDALASLIADYKKKLNWNHYLGLVDLDADEVVLKQSVIDRETEASKIYAVTDDEIKTYEFLQGVITLAQEKFGNKHVSLGNLLSNTVACGPTSYNGEDWVYKVRAQNIKNIFGPYNNLY